MAESLRPRQTFCRQPLLQAAFRSWQRRNGKHAASKTANRIVCASCTGQLRWPQSDSALTCVTMTSATTTRAMLGGAGWPSAKRLARQCREPGKAIEQLLRRSCTIDPVDPWWHAVVSICGTRSGATIGPN
jgi:hypothetical protein